MSRVEYRRLVIVLSTVAISIVGVTLLGLVPQYSDWKTGLLLNLIENTVLLIYVLRTRDTFILHLMLFGLFVGLAELIADAWLVDATRTLDYAWGGGPMLWRSPIWMPLAWEMVSVQFGYLGMRLIEWRRALGVFLIGLLGAINIPYYEEMALRIHWWRYVDTRMLLHTPYYIIVGEFLIAICLALTALPLRRQSISKTMLMGILGGVLIFPCYVVGFWATEKLF